MQQKTIVTAVAQVTEVIYDPLEDTVVVTIGTERILLLDNHGQVVGGRLTGVHVGLLDGEHGNHDPTHCLFMMVILMVMFMWIIVRKN